MKALPTLAAMLLTASGSAAPPLAAAQAAPGQPVIQMPRPTAAAGQSFDRDANPDLLRSPCVGDGSGYVRARIRGALQLDLNWHDAQMQCGGDVRPDGGLRVSFAGPGPNGKVMRLVFGMRAARPGSSGKELPTNLTVLLDGGRTFATRGDDKCTMDQLSQRALPGRTAAGKSAPGSSAPGNSAVRAWRIEARGFCVYPANAVTGQGRILVSRFDFAGRIEL
jgi:hypothetical protein